MRTGPVETKVLRLAPRSSPWSRPAAPVPHRRVETPDPLRDPRTSRHQPVAWSRTDRESPQSVRDPSPGRSRRPGRPPCRPPSDRPVRAVRDRPTRPRARGAVRRTAALPTGSTTDAARSGGWAPKGAVSCPPDRVRRHPPDPMRRVEPMTPAARRRPTAGAWAKTGAVIRRKVRSGPRRNPDRRKGRRGVATSVLRPFPGRRERGGRGRGRWTGWGRTIGSARGGPPTGRRPDRHQSWPGRADRTTVDRPGSARRPGWARRARRARRR